MHRKIVAWFHEGPQELTPQLIPGSSHWKSQLTFTVLSWFSLWLNEKRSLKQVDCLTRFVVCYVHAPKAHSSKKKKTGLKLWHHAPLWSGRAAGESLASLAPRSPSLCCGPPRNCPSKVNSSQRTTRNTSSTTEANAECKESISQCTNFKNILWAEKRTQFRKLILLPSYINIHSWLTKQLEIDAPGKGWTRGTRTTCAEQKPENEATMRE